MSNVSSPVAILNGHILKHRYRYILMVYIMIIVIFAGFYEKYGSEFSGPIHTYSDAFYFSIVTITTLGYGDISPTSVLTKGLVAIQALYGIFTFGMLFHAMGISSSMRTEQRKNESIKDHLLEEYHYCRLQLIRIILACGEESDSPETIKITKSLPKEEDLAKYLIFREYFQGKNEAEPIFYEFMNRLNDENSKHLKEVFLELELLSNSIKYALSNVSTSNRVQHDVLVRISQAALRYKISYMYEDDPGKYVGSLVFEILASWSTATGAYDGDFVEKAIRDY